MEITFFEISQATKWAMYSLKEHKDIRIVLNVANIDKTSQWFISELPDSRDNWHMRVNDDKLIEIINGTNPFYTTLYLRFFEAQCPFTNLYVGLYDANGIRFVDVCLIIWNRKHPEVTNQGFAPGRCPDKIENIKNVTYTSDMLYKKRL